MDWSSIITGVVTGLCALAGTYIAHNKTTALILYRIEELEKKQDKHNNTIERMYKVESAVKTAFLKIDELKEDLKNE